MKKMKKVLSAVISLAVLSVVYAPAISASNTGTEGSVVVPISAQIPGQENIGSYITFNGIIDEVTHVEDYYMVTVTGEGENNTMVLRVFSDTVVLLQSLMSSVNPAELVVGQKITAAYGSNAPVSMSMPPQVNPEVVVVMDKDDAGKVKTDVFDTRGQSSDKMLVLNVSDSTVIIDTEGVPVDKADIANGTLVVFYIVETRSLPPQTSPEKIIVLKRGEADKPTSSKQDQMELLLELLSGEQLVEKEGLRYARLIDVASHLGYEVGWNGETSTVTLQSGTVAFSFKLGEDMYTHNLELGHFANAPIVINDRTFIEERFIVDLILDETIVE